MAGQPRTRAKRAAAAEKKSAAATNKPGSRARGGGTAKSKAPAKRKAPAKKPPGKRGPGRPRFEPAALVDYQAVAEAEAKALEVVEKEKPLTAADRVQRDESVVAMWALGMTPPTISQRIGLGADHVRAILRAHRERRGSTVIPSSSELLHDMLDRIEALIERTSLLASSATIYHPDGQQHANDSVRLGAIRTLLDLYTSQAGLWQAMGLVGQRPSDDMRAERARDLLRRLLDELRGLGVDQGQIDEAARRVLTPGAAGDRSIVPIDGRATG